MRWSARAAVWPTSWARRPQIASLPMTASVGERLQADRRRRQRTDGLGHRRGVRSRRPRRRGARGRRRSGRSRTAAARPSRSTAASRRASSPKPSGTRRWRTLTFTTDIAELADRQLVVEAVVEDEALKVEIFQELDKVVTDEQAILASNTSSIPIMKLGIATARPEQVIGIHFFNPVPVLRLVELVTSLMTSPETIAARRRPSPPTCSTRR